MKLILNKKTGFKSDSDRVEIWRNGWPFYVRSKRKKEISFNLPIGKFDIREGDIKKLIEPIEYKKIKLPKPNKPTYFTGKIIVKWINNPHRCSVSFRSGNAKFLFDHSYKEYPDFVIIWICGHELAHFLYRGQKQFSEKMCDNYSANMMLELGYNHSQIKCAIDMAISSGYLAQNRKDFLYNNLLKNQ